MDVQFTKCRLLRIISSFDWIIRWMNMDDFTYEICWIPFGGHFSQENPLFLAEQLQIRLISRWIIILV